MKDAAKTVSFGIMHFAIAFSVVWLMTGDVVLGGAVALIEPLVNTVGYYFHEKIWQLFLLILLFDVLRCCAAMLRIPLLVLRIKAICS